MLDTDMVSYALRGERRVSSKLLQHSRSLVCVSAISVAELRFGADRRYSAKIHALIDEFLSYTAVVPFDERCASHFGRISSELARSGVPISKFDALIAAHAVALDLTLVTNNIKHFERVQGLRVENWL
jgi:tRNA(fMet)-specific endonuclease VapC